MKLFALAAALAGLAGPAAPVPDPGRHLFVWSIDSAKTNDFLAVIDADPASPGYGDLIASAPIGQGGTSPHHTEHEMPSGGVLFANAFGAGRTFRFDLSDPRRPRLAGHFDQAGDYMHPHSFTRLPNGNVLATFQMKGHGNARPGALVELDPEGRVVRTSDASDRREPNAFLRPYSLAIVPKLNRVVTTSADMHAKEPSHFVQVWRLRDLKLLQTVRLPQGPRGEEGTDPAEPRLLADGRTVMVNSFNCGLFLLSDLRRAPVRAKLVATLGDGGKDCALPVVSGKTWIQTDASIPGLVALDIGDPAHPREVARLTLPKGYLVHWIALSPDRRRIVISGRGEKMLHRLLIAEYDPESRLFRLDHRFGRSGSGELGISLDRTEWPHGAGGPAIPHGVVFSR